MEFPLHHAVWRNDVESLQSCSKEDLDRPDSRSGWTPLHVAMYYGHLVAAAYLLRCGSRLDLPDKEDKTPLDYLREPAASNHGCKTDVFSWGSGVNYQLGTGNTSIQFHPRRLDRLGHLGIINISAAKFHSLALTSDGRVFSWGWDNRGRLGHSYERQDGTAQIFPRPVSGLFAQKVTCIAAAKHHSLAVTSTGDVYSWGWNPDGRLGYSLAGNRYVKPRKVPMPKGVLAVLAAAANKHSAVIVDSGDVYTWGSNVYGQLGYGTSDSAFSPTPQRVDSLHKRIVSQVSLAKRHSIALTNDGEVFTWGNKNVAPKKVQLGCVRDSTKGARPAGNSPNPGVWIHEAKKPVAVDISAGLVRSCCLLNTGAVLSWKSDEPQGVREVGGKLKGSKAVCVSSGKTATAVVLENGRVYSWDHSKDPQPELVRGVRSASGVSVGEIHFIAMQKWSAADWEAPDKAPSEVSSERKFADLEDPTLFKCLDVDSSVKAPPCPATRESLQLMCEKKVIRNGLSPSNAVQLFRYADTISADLLRQCSLDMIVRNLAIVFQESTDFWTVLPEDLLLEVERRYKTDVLSLDVAKATVSWLDGGYPDQDVTGSLFRQSGARDDCQGSAVGSIPEDKAALLKIKDSTETKLKQIQMLLERQKRGEVLNPEQTEKIKMLETYQKVLRGIDGGMPLSKVKELLQRKKQKSRRQKNKKKEKVFEDSKPPKPSPNLLPVKPPPPKLRDIGPLPRFLEPKPKVVRAPPKDEEGDKERKWWTVGLKNSTRTTDGSVIKAQPAKAPKMSLKEFMTEPFKSQPPKETGHPWGGIKPTANNSFASIQYEQRNRRPGMASVGLKPVVERRRTVSRWHIHSDVQIQSISCIQIEEKAIQQLSALYKDATVKIKPGTARDLPKS